MIRAVLASLHLAAADCPAELGNLTPAREQISEGLDALERRQVLATAIVDALRTRHHAMLARVEGRGPVIVLHGDAHAGNLLAAPGGWRWIDLGGGVPRPG